jgi:hypothetical protein
MSDSGIELVYRGEAIARSETAQMAWTRAKEKAMALVKDASYIRIQKEIAKDIARAEYWRKKTCEEWGRISTLSAVFAVMLAFSVWLIKGAPLLGLYFAPVWILTLTFLISSSMHSIFFRWGPVRCSLILSIVFLPVVIIMLATSLTIISILLLQEINEVKRTIVIYVPFMYASFGCFLLIITRALVAALFLVASTIYSKVTDMNAAEPEIRARAKMAAIAHAAAREAPQTINAALKATRFWATAGCWALHNLLVADDSPEVRAKVIPAFTEMLKATKAWEKAESMCHQVVVVSEVVEIIENRFKLARATRILEAVIAAEAVSREAEKMFYQVIPCHPDTQQQ